MTPSEIYNTKFEKAMGGYKQEDVNRFQIEVGDYLEQLVAERDELLKKMEFLAEKLEEYRADEESLRAAIIGAQKLGDSVVKESKQKAELLLTEAKSEAAEIMADARYKSETMLEDTKHSIETEQYALERAKAEVAKFKRMILSMYEHQIVLINTIPYTDNLEPQPPVHMSHPGSIGNKITPEKAISIGNNTETEGSSEGSPEDEILSKLVFESVSVTEDLPVEGEDNGSSKRGGSSRFGPLKFGDDYSLTRKD